MRIDKFCEELMKKPDDIIRQDSDSMSRELSDNCKGVHWDYLLKMLTVALCHYARKARCSRWRLAKDVLRTMRLLAKA